MGVDKKTPRRAIASYEKSCETAVQKLIEKIEPAVREACEKWGFRFCAGNGTYTFYAAENPLRRQYRKVDGQYFLLGDPNFLIDLLEPDLANCLEYGIGNRQPLGSLIDDVDIDASQYKWVLIKANEWCLDEEVDRPTIETNFDKAEIANGMTYFGWVTRQLAEKVIESYAEDWKSGRELLASLPSIIDELAIACLEAA